MSIDVNFVSKETDGKFFNEPIMVTITLEEYRSLVQEVKRLECEIFRADEIINRLTDENLKLQNRRCDNG